MKKYQNNGKFLFCLVGLLLAVGALDEACAALFGDLTLAPPLAIICLGILALFFSWRKVLLALPLFMVWSYYLVADVARFPMIRAISVGLAGGLATWAAFQRGKLVFHANEVDAILQNLNLAWLLSDQSGNVIQISSKALQLMSLESAPVTGTSYFSIFAPREGKGELIRKYMNLLASSAKPIRVTLTSARSPHAQFKAIMVPLESSGEKRILTSLENA